MNVNPGEFKKRITIIKYTAGGTDEDGYPTGKQKETVRSCKAKVTNVSGKEMFVVQTELSEINKRFLVRYTKDVIDTSMIVEYQGKEYDIEYVSDIEDAHAYIEIWVKRRAGNGI